VNSSATIARHPDVPNLISAVMLVPLWLLGRMMIPLAPMIVSAHDARLVLSTAGSREEAESIAESLVDLGLAACVNLVTGVTSIYRWQGSIERADEIILIIKTTEPRLAELEAALRKLHSYEVPELLVLTPERGGENYLAWLAASTTEEK
jgi:periplasmic divalent cation tolerance protein